VISDYIQNNVLTPEQRDFNQNVVYGSEKSTSDPALIAQMARQYPMMADRRVVIVKEAQGMKNWDPLTKYLNNMGQSSSIIVLCFKNATMDKRQAIYKAISNVGVVMEGNKLKEWQLPAFIEKYVKERGATIDEKSTQIIADHIGSDLHRITSELDKLLIGLGDSKSITPEAVEKTIGVSKDFNTFELKDAIITKNVYKANQIIKYFDENSKSGNLYTTVPLLFNYFRNLMMAYYAPQKTPDGLASFLELRSSWQTKDYSTGMRNYSGVKVMQIIDKIRETDAKMKGLDNASTDAGQLLKELIFFIFH